MCRMQKIRALNASLLNNEISPAAYKRAAENEIGHLDWQRQIKYRNMMLA